MRRGSLPNEHGTWYSGRNGWCDGQDVAPLVWDITHAVQAEPGAQFDVSYYALSYDVGGANPTDAGCGGHIIMSSNVVFYAA